MCGLIFFAIAVFMAEGRQAGVSGDAYGGDTQKGGADRVNRALSATERIFMDRFLKGAPSYPRRRVPCIRCSHARP